MTRQPNPILGLELEIVRKAPEPLHLQLERQLREAIAEGRLRPGEAVPSTRSLASELGIARAVVVDAYSQLAAEGYLSPCRGSGTTVTRTVRAPTRRIAAQSKLPPAEYDFDPTMPDLNAFPISNWMSCTQRAFGATPQVALGAPDPQGVPMLRDVLSAYLRRTRGAIGDPNRVIICNGHTHGLALICRALQAKGARRVAVEDPGRKVHRETIALAGLEPVPVTLDNQGIRVDELAQRSVDAVVVTAAHQFPSGSAMSAARRKALVDWSMKTEAVVIEDDYDAPYRYDGRPVGALQGLAPDHVAYAGSASQILAPGLGLGWLLLPSAMIEPVVREQALDDLASNAPTQLTLAWFIEKGHLDRHLRRARRTYGNRRAALVDALATYLPQARIQGIAAGLHVLALLPDQVDETDLCERARAGGVALYGLRTCRATPDAWPPGLVLGYASLPESKLVGGLEALADALRARHAPQPHRGGTVAELPARVPPQEPGQRRLSAAQE